ncbi:MAG: MotA/TolQ/ExbB proton channel family protein [Planctomycetaceae bacterium]
MKRTLLIFTTLVGFWSIAAPMSRAQGDADPGSGAAQDETAEKASTAATDSARNGATPAKTDEPAATPDDTGASDTGLSGSLDEMLHSGAMGLMLKGGIFMWFILPMGILAFGVIIERYRSLKMLATDTQALRSQVRTLLEQDQAEEALNLCESQQGPVPAILSAGLRKYVVLRRLGYDAARIEEQVVKAMDDYGVHVVAALEKHLPSLATVASVAPMLGFLGTVSGMVNSFDTIVAQMGETNIVEAAAGGISEALLTTAFGLIIGIPAYVAFNYFTSVINRFVLEVEESATELIETVTLQMALRQREAEEA